MDDWGLICEYVGKGSAGAFEALVGRYLEMVYGVALREVGEHHLAEDVTQAVFGVLAKKAPEMRRETVVAGWLFRTTRYVAMNAKKMERRRRFHEERAGRMKLEVGEDAGAVREEKMYRLDCAMERLGEPDRGVLLLRYYRRLEMEEVARSLGVSEMAARRRVERAVGRLRVKMGAGVGEVGAAGMVGAVGIGAMKSPAGVAAVSLACAKGLPGHEAVAIVMKGALKMMFWMQMKVAAMVTVGVLVLGGAGAVTVSKLAAATDEEKPAVVAVAEDPFHHQLMLLEKELAMQNQDVRMMSDALAAFKDENDIPLYREAIVQQYDRLSRLETQADDAEMRIIEASSVLDAARKEADGKGSLTEAQRNIEHAQEELDRAHSGAKYIESKREEFRVKLRKLEQRFQEYEERSARLKVQEAVRNELEEQVTKLRLQLEAAK